MLIMEVLRKAAAGGAAVLITSHDPRVIDLCDREVQIAHGRLAGKRAYVAPMPTASRPSRGPRSSHTSAKTIRFVLALLVAIAGALLLVAFGSA